MSQPKKNDLLTTARERYKRAIDAEDDNRKHAVEVLKFRNGEHWDARIKRDRMTDPEGPRPCVVVDKTEQHLNQVVNDERQNRPAIKVRPADDKGDPEVAEVLQGVVYNIMDQSVADIAIDTAYEHAASFGFGYIRVITEYSDPMAFEQDIKVKRVRNALQIILDPDRQEPDGSDAQFAFVVEKMPKDEYESQYGKDFPIDFEQESRIYDDWIQKEHVIVAEYWRIEYEKATICLYTSGHVCVKGEPVPPDAGLPVLENGKPVERSTRIPRVKWSKINGKQELESRDWPGKYIPIIEVVGKELDIEGKVVKSGLLKTAMEPQRIHDYSASAFIENVALAPRAPWVAAEGQLEGNENEWRTANRRNISVLSYKPLLMDGNTLVPPPSRTPPPGIPVGWQQTLLNSEHDIQAAMGRYNASLGADSNEKSGVALQKKQREGDTATFHFQDNLARSIRHLGRVILDLIPEIYDTRRVVRILGEDGSADQVTFDAGLGVPMSEESDEMGAIQKIYDPTVGKYDVVATAGPSYATKRVESAEQMVQVVTAKPELMGIIGDLVFRNMDWPGAEQIADRLKKMLPPNLQETEEGEEQPMVPTPQGPVPVPQAAQMIEALTAQLGQAAEQLKQAGDLQEIQQQVKDEANRVALVKQAVDAKEAIGKATQEADDARSEAERTKVISDLKLMVADVLARMEGMKKHEEEVKAAEAAGQDEMMRAHEAAQRDAKEADRQARNDAISQQQAELVAALQQAIMLLSAPRKKTPVRDQSGEITQVIDEPMMQ